MGKQTVSDHKLQEYTESLKKKSEIMLVKDFPDKVLELDSLLKSEPFTLENLPALLKTSNDSLPLNNTSQKGEEKNAANSQSECKALINSNIQEMFVKTKPIFRNLADDVQTIRLWILLSIPRIEDGNNFGVSIQEEAVCEASRIESDANDLLDMCSEYHSARAKIMSKLLKYPQIDDYRQSIIEYDESMFYRLKNAIRDSRNDYARMHDLFIKNIEKINNPRSDHGVGMF